MSISLTRILQQITGLNTFFQGPNAGRSNGVVLEDSATVTWTTDGQGNIQATAEGGSAPSGAENLVYATPNGASGDAALRALVPADLPVATASALGAVQPDGTTIDVTAGVISVAASLPTTGFGGNTQIGNLLNGGAAGIELVTFSPLYLISSGNSLKFGGSYGAADAELFFGNASIGGFVQVAVGAQLTAAATVAPTNAIHHVTGTTVIETLTPPVTGGHTVTLIPDEAGMTWGATGNIAVAGSFVLDKAVIFTYDGTKYYPSAVS